MGGVIKIFGTIIFGLIVLFLMLNFDRRILLEDDVFESTRSTQLSAIADSINLGDLFVNGNLSITEKNAIDIWMKNFKENRNLNFKYVIDILAIHENPPAIAVRVRGYSSLSMNESDLEIDYINIILVDEK